MSNLAIETLSLGRSFGSNIAVGGVDIAVRKGEIYGFLGAKWCREVDDCSNAVHSSPADLWGRKSSWLRCDGHT